MLTKDYVLGLVDGEGSFNVRINDDKRRSKIELKFSLKLRHQDKEILEKLQEFFGCGNVYIQRDKRENHSLCYRFEVQNKKDIFKKIILWIWKKLNNLKNKCIGGSPYTRKPSVQWERLVTYKVKSNARQANRAVFR